MKPPFMRKAKRSKKSAVANAANNELEKLSAFDLVSIINTAIGILKKRGVSVTDWDDRTKDVCGMRFFGKTAYILAPSRRGHGRPAEAAEEGNPKTPGASG